MQISSRRRRETIKVPIWWLKLYCTYRPCLNFLAQLCYCQLPPCSSVSIFSPPVPSNNLFRSFPPSLMVPPYNDWSHSPAPANEKLNEPAPADLQKDKPKKPRHRHSAFQLAALNERYDKNEHPPLEERTALAQRLSM